MGCLVFIGNVCSRWLFPTTGQPVREKTPCTGMSGRPGGQHEDPWRNRVEAAAPLLLDPRVDLHWRYPFKLPSRVIALPT